MLRMSAKHADGVLINAAHPRDLEWAAGQIEQGLAERPDEHGAFESLAFASVSVAADEDEAREAARPPVAFIAGAAAEPVLERHEIDREAAEAVSDALERGELGEAFGCVTPEIIDAFCIAGTTETVAEQFEAALEYVDGIVVGSPIGPRIVKPRRFAARQRRSRSVGGPRRRLGSAVVAVRTDVLRPATRGTGVRPANAPVFTARGSVSHGAWGARSGPRNGSIAWPRGRRRALRPPGHDEGGDKREDLAVQSAAVVVASTEDHDMTPPYNDLRVDATETPIADLQATYDLAMDGYRDTLARYEDAYEADSLAETDE